MRKLTASIIGFILSIFLLGCQSQHEGLDYYQDGEFKNLEGENDHTISDLFNWIFTEDAKDWPENVELSVIPEKPPERSVEPRITFIGHSTFLIQVDNINILTDPVFSDRVSPVQWAGPKRVMPNGLEMEDLPKIDFIVISHNHYDHLDHNSLDYFKERDNPAIFGGLGIGAVNKDFEITEMAWWEELEHNGSRVAFTPCQHFSGRGLFDRNESLWGGFYIATENLSIYFAGDTGYSNHFKEVKERYRHIDIAILPIGAYKPNWFMGYIHMDPEQSVQAHKDLDPKLSIAMHWGTFQLSNEGREEPVTDLNKALKENDVSNYKVMDVGETLHFQ